MSDEMPRWVCNIGGYEPLAPSHVTAPDEHRFTAQQWVARFNCKPHPSVAGTNLPALHTWALQDHYGTNRWGDLHRTSFPWRGEWLVRLLEEAERRERDPLVQHIRIIDPDLLRMMIPAKSFDEYVGEMYGEIDA